MSNNTLATHKKVLIIGAGFAGLAAALELSKNNVATTLVEKTNGAGGLSQTISLDGIKFELGPHIYFDKDQDVVDFWKDLVGDKMKPYERNNRIFYKGNYIKSPLSITDTLFKLGIFKATELVASFAWAKLQSKEVNSAEDWVKVNFGKGLYNTFFKVYNEKIWGIPCNEISPNWAGQRIKSSLSTMVVKSVSKDKDFIIKTFDFPDGGSATIYNAQTERLAKATNTKLVYNCYPTKIKININSKGETEFLVDFNTGEKEVQFTDIISTIHIADFFSLLDKNSLQQLNINVETTQKAIDKLLYRHLVLVNLVFDRKNVMNFQEHWIDVHEPDVQTLRVTNFGNYKLALTDDKRSGVGLEYNCFEQDKIWKQTDAEILEIALQDLKKMNIANVKPLNFSVVRLPKSYPVYFKGYEEHTKVVFETFAKIANLHLAGRNALYKWNNMHHSVKTGLLAARNSMGETNDLFSVKGMVSIGKDND